MILNTKSASGQDLASPHYQAGCSRLGLGRVLVLSVSVQTHIFVTNAVFLGIGHAMVARVTVSDFNDFEAASCQSPRPETPEPDSRQGRRNPPPGVQLLDDEGSISEKVRENIPDIGWVCLLPLST